MIRTAEISKIITLVTTLLLTLACSPPPDESTQPEPPVPQLEVAATVSSGTEGPVGDAEGNVYFTEMGSSTIWKYSAAGELSVFRRPSNRANGLLIDHEGRLVAAEGSDAETDQPRITRTNLQTGEVEILADRYEGKRLNQPNDVTIDGQGRIYFTDRPRPKPMPDQTNVIAVYRIDPDGRIVRILAEPEIDRPNGLVVSPDEKTFYLVEAHRDKDHARMIRAYDLQADGSVTNMRVFHDFYPGRSADGIGIDTEGNVYAAAGMHKLRGSSETLDTRCGVHVFSPDGALKQFVPIPEDLLTNVGFGGPDMKTVYVSASNKLFRFRADVAGTRR